MNSSTETILLYIIAAGIISIIYGFFTGRNILNSSSGNAKMIEIASAIQEGARAYLNRQYKTIAIVGVVVLVKISLSFSILVGLGYLIGAALSGIAGYVGMLVSVQANVRTAEASRKGLNEGLAVAFKSGAVTGIPLLLFASSAKRIPLSILGILQYITPTIQFLLGVFAYSETFDSNRLIGYSIIWSGLVIFELDSFRFASNQASHEK